MVTGVLTWYVIGCFLIVVFFVLHQGRTRFYLRVPILCSCFLQLCHCVQEKEGRIIVDVSGFAEEDAQKKTDRQKIRDRRNKDDLLFVSTFSLRASRAFFFLDGCVKEMGFWEEYGIWVDFGFNRSGSGSTVSRHHTIALEFEGINCNAFSHANKQ